MIAKFLLICFSISVLIMMWRVDQAEGTLAADYSVANVIEDVSKRVENLSSPIPPIAVGRKELIDEACGGPNRGEGMGNVVIKLPNGNWIGIMKVRRLSDNRIFGIQNVGDGTYRRVLWDRHDFCAS